MCEQGKAQRMVLLLIVDRQGSAPNGPGAKMLLFEDGRMRGTVGGGASEARLLHLAQKKLHEEPPGSAEVLRLHHDGRTGPEGSGMICSGSQTYVLMIPSPADLRVAAGIAAREGEGREAELHLTVGGLELREPGPDNKPYHWEPDRAQGWRYREQIGVSDHAILIGGGHVALALSEVLVRLDFRVTVLDNRKALPTMADNVWADQLRVVDYQQIAQEVPEDPRSYVCIMTCGYRSDLRVLRQLAGRSYPYLGLLGSRAKIDRIFEQLKSDGVAEAGLQAVYAPMGLPIGSSTPEEIAVSIAAEIIRVRGGI